MKKILFGLLAIAALSLTGCGNHDVSFGSYSFHYVHVQMYGSEPTHFKVNKWQNDDGGIELSIEGHGRILLGDGTYMMYDQETCPICGNVKYK